MNAEWADTLIGHEKSLPERAIGLTAAEFVATGVRLSELDTPLVALDRIALQHNVDLLADWAAAAGVQLQPHGKTTMAPALWQMQLAAGATGVTVANASQARIAHWAGVGRVQIANELTSAAQVAEVARMNAAGTEVIAWVDSPAAVQLVSDAVVAGGFAPVGVCVELGAPGGRAGARSVEEGLSVAELVSRAPGVELRGVAGYEGAIGHARAEDGLAMVDAYLDGLAAVLRGAAGWIADGGPGLVSAGGSSFFDRVVARLGGLTADGVAVVLRSGASILHDHGVYERTSPLSRTNRPDAADADVFWPAARGFGRVHSSPEPGLVIVEGGKRDFAYDIDRPVLLADPDGSTVSSLNDQHNFLRTTLPYAPGDLVTYGLSHPCTILDKWRWVPLVDGWDDDDPAVVDLVRTWF